MLGSMGRPILREGPAEGSGRYLTFRRERMGVRRLVRQPVLLPRPRRRGHLGERAARCLTENSSQETGASRGNVERSVVIPLSLNGNRGTRMFLLGMF
jgi:hypothetical protein